MKKLELWACVVSLGLVVWSSGLLRCVFVSCSPSFCYLGVLSRLSDLGRQTELVSIWCHFASCWPWDLSPHNFVPTVVEHRCSKHLERSERSSVFPRFPGTLESGHGPSLQIKCIWGISKRPGLPNACVICLPKMEEAISERPCLDFICFQPTCAVLMRTAAVTIGSLCVQCTVLGASLMIWWIFSSLSRTICI